MPARYILLSCLSILLSVFTFSFAQQPKLMLPIGHTKDINSVEFSPDGKKIVTASDDKTAKIWDVASGYLLLNLKGDSAEVTSAQFSPDGKNILTASDSTVKIWDAETGNLLKEIKDSLGDIGYAQFSPDGKNILTASDSTVKIWDKKTWNILKEIKDSLSDIGYSEFSPDGKNILTASDSTVKIWDKETGRFLFGFNWEKGYFSFVHYSMDGKKIVAVSGDFTVRIWNAETGQLLPEANVIKKNIDYLEYSPDGKNILTRGRYDTVKIWDGSSGRLLFSLHEGTNTILQSKYSPDGKKILIRYYDNTVKIWDANTGQLLSVARGHAPKIDDIQYSPDGKKIISTGSYNDDIPGSGWVWDVVSGKLLQPVKADTTTRNIKVLYSPDGKKVVTVTTTTTASPPEDEPWPEEVKLWDVASGKLIKTLSGAAFFKVKIKFSPDGKKMVSFSEDDFSPPTIFDANTGKQLGELPYVYSRIISIQFSPDGKKILARSLKGSIQSDELRVWDVATMKVLKEWNLSENSLNDAQISPDGKRMFIWLDSTIRIWDFTTFKPLFPIKGSGFVSFIAYSPDGKKIVTNKLDSTINLWDANTGKFLINLKGRSTGVISIEFSPDFKKILTASYHEKVARVWDAATGNLLNELRGHDDIVSHALFSPDGKSIATASQDNTIKKWDVTTGKCLYTFFAVDKNDYLVVDNDNHFDGTKAAINLLYFTCGTEIVDLKQAKETLYIPGLAKLINNGEIINTKTLDELDLCGLTPEVDVTTSNTVDYFFKIKPRRGGIGTTELFINGKLLSTYQPGDLEKSGDGFELKIKKEKLTPYLPDPINIVSVKAYTDADHNSVPSREVNISVHKNGPPPPPPNLYAVMVGVSDYKSADMQLNYAAIDANDMSDALEKAAKKLLGNDHVFMYNLTTAEKHDLLPYKKNIKQVFDSIGKKAVANDILLIFLSGHGVTRKKDNQFYYMTAEAASLEEENISSDFGISTEELTDWMKLENIKAQKRILIMDACYSGQAINNFITRGSGNPGFLAAKGDDNWQQKKAIESLNDNSGMIILSASSSAQLSWESKAYSHGYLTYSLLLAIKQSIPGNTLDISEWFSAAKKTVMEVSKKWGAAQEPQFIPSTNFPIGMVDKDVMAGIKLPEEKQLFIPSNFQNDDTTADGDNLLLGQKIDEALNEISSTAADSKIVFLLASSSAEACLLSGRYVVKGNMVTVRVSIKKNNQRKYWFEEKGTTDRLPDLANRIAEKAAEWVSDNISNK